MLLSMQQCITAYAQHIEYAYDAAGNRILRTFLTPRMNNNDTSKSDPKAQQIAAQHGISVYPNPPDGGNNITVAISSTGDKTAEESTVYLLDNNGKLLFSQKQTTASPSQIDLSNYAAGIYYVKVMVGKDQLFYKVTKPK